MLALQPAHVDLDTALLKARVKARLLGQSEAVRIGRFELKRRCGQGGQGVVFEAHDPSLGRSVALKCLHADEVAAGGSLQREFRALAQLVHPNLALLYELFHSDGRWFHTMELLSGVDFLSHVRGQDGWDESRLRAALAQLLAGLCAIHAAGKVHRDLKPSNVLVEPNGRVVIVDYGLMVESARARARQGRSGTAAYMAPEQRARGVLQPATDMYAVGVMLYEALTGVRPEQGLARELAREQEASRSRASSGAPSPTDLERLCTELLAGDPLRRPSASEALARVEARPALPALAPSLFSGPETFVGRAAELSRLRAAYERARAGHATVVLLHGESGMGKSALLTQLAGELAQRSPRPRLLLGRCYERESTAYKVFDGVMEAIGDDLASLPAEEASALLPRDCAALAQIFPVFRRFLASAGEALALEPRDRNEQRRQAFASARELFQRLRAEGPVVVCVDDLQWGDVDSVRLLQELLSGPDAPALLWVGAYRAREQGTSPFLSLALADDALAQLGCELLELPLGPLARCEARELVCQTLRAPLDAQLSAHIDTAAGIPFLLRELAAHQPEAIPMVSSELSAPLLVQGRRARCSPPAHALLEVLCVAGRPLELKLALRVSRLESEGWAAASELCAARLARWRDTHGERCLEPYHDLIREAIAREAGRARNEHVHATIAREMEALAMDEPERLVHHLIAAGQREQAGQQALDAARRAAQKLAWESAAELHGLALELVPERQITHVLQEQHGDYLAYAGRHRAAAHAYLRAVPLSPPAQRSPLSRRAAQQLMRAGDVRAATALLSQLLDAIGLRFPRSEAHALAVCLSGRLRRRLSGVGSPSPTRQRPAHEAQRLATLAAVYAELWLVDPVRALAIHTWFFADACRSKDRYCLQALTWEASNLAVVDGPAARPRLARLLAEIDALAEGGAPYDRATALLARSLCLIHADQRPRDALALIREAELILSNQCSGVHFEVSQLALMRDYTLEASGNFAELSETVLREERARGAYDDGYSLQRLLISVPLARLTQDRPDLALRFLATRYRRSTSRATVSDFSALMRLSSVHLYAGDARRAFQTLEREWLWLRLCGMFQSAPMREHADFQRACCAATLYLETRDPIWKEVARKREWCLPGPKTRGARALDALIEASLARADGDGGRCSALLSSAAREFKRSQNDSALWAVRYRLAQVEGAAEALAEAHDWMSTRGIRNPERWVAMYVPAAAGCQSGPRASLAAKGLFAR